MTDLLDRAIKSALQDFFDAAPERSEVPLESARTRKPGISRTTVLAAASVVVIGVGGLVAVRLGDRQTSRGATTPDSSTAHEPTSTIIISAEQTYIVQTGDFLAAIAEQHCVTMDEITNYNNWADGAAHPLFPEQVILIPPGGCAPSVVDDGTPMVPTVFPVLQTSDVGAGRPMGHFSQVSWGNPPRVDAALGRIDPDERIIDGVVVQVGESFIGQTSDHEAVTVFGHDATLYRDGGTPVITTVVWGSDPYIAVTGLDPMAFLEAASEDFVAIETYDNGSPSALTFGELPSGYEVVVESTRLARGSVDASLGIEDSSADGTSIHVSVTNPLLSALTVGPVTPVDVGGTRGWLASGAGNSVTWQVDDTTYAQISGSDSVDAALDLADAIDWVEVGTWITTYDVEFPVPPPNVGEIQPPVGTVVPESSTTSLG